MKTMIDKTVNLDLGCYKDDLTVLAGLFKYQARKEAWEEPEIDTVIAEANRLKDRDHFIETIRAHCEVRIDQHIDPKEVWEVLSQLGLHTHYLASKTIASWDSYDVSNFRSLMIKAGKLKKMYGIYDTNVSQEDISHVDSHPNFFFDSREKAEAVMREFIADGIFQADDIHVLFRYKKTMTMGLMTCPSTKK